MLLRSLFHQSTLYKQSPIRYVHSLIQKDDLIHRLDLRVGKVMSVEAHPDATHLFIEKVELNLDDEVPCRTIVSGLAPYMSKESIQNKYVIVVKNLKPSKFRGVLSEGMLLAASDEKAVDLLSPSDQSVIGERVALEGVEWEGEASTILRPKLKIFEQIAAELKTDKEGNATYKGVRLVTSAGPVTSVIRNGGIS
ncbi:hypothetical protein BDB01DRAFT_494055 [Pilobolus umbonatus]|nr:hypothetical protein BDB01DRAFT_494055 [Pilobolus umbonatus]